jgi:hypothetical protein
VAQGQVALKLGDGRFLANQPLADRPRPLVCRRRLGWLVGLAERLADVVMAIVQLVMEVCYGGVVASQPFLDLTRPLDRRQRLGGLPVARSCTPTCS